MKMIMKKYWIATTFLLLQIGDVVSTVFALQQPGVYELNPLYYSMGWKFWILKAVVAVIVCIIFQIVLTGKLKYFVYSGFTIMAFAVINNVYWIMR